MLFQSLQSVLVIILIIALGYIYNPQIETLQEL